MRRMLGAIGAGMLLNSAVLAQTTMPTTASSQAVSPPPTSRTFELTNGHFTEVPSTDPDTLPKPDPRLRQIEAVIDRHDFSAAEAQTLGWLLGHKGDANYDFGLFLMAEAVNGNDDPLRAFYYCDELMDGYPASQYFTPALQLQYDMGDQLLNGRMLKVLGLKILDGEDEGIEIMFRVQQRSPGSPLSEKALRRTADFYFANGDFDLAADAYGAHIKAYPRDPDIAEIMLRQAFSNYAQFTGVRFDPTPLVNARSQMKDLIDAYPEVAARENIPSFVDAIDKTLARKLFVTADFYHRTNKPDAEKAVLAVLVKQYPQSDEAQQARKMLAQG